MQTITTTSKNEGRRVDMTVEVAATTITVRRGRFRVWGVDYELVQDEVFTLESAPEEDTWIDGLLVWDDDTRAVALLVDEYSLVLPRFAFRNSSYQRLAKVWGAEVASGASTLDSDAVHHYRTIAPEGGDDGGQDE